jgi:hypothetical protein
VEVRGAPGLEGGLASRAWVLDPVAFHLDLELLRRSPDGLVAVRDAALRVWRSTDPLVLAYLQVLSLGDPEEWVTGPEPAHMVDWYRLLMGPHLVPIRAFRCPDVLRRRLPDLGWPPMEARRLARGRELLQMAERYASPRIAEELSPHMRLGNKGWLDHDDVVGAIERMRSLPREVFRHHQDLVPVVEDAFEVLEAAATKPDHVVLLVAD